MGISKFDTMQPLDTHLSHLVSNRVIAIARRAVDTRPNQEICPDLLRCAEQLVDVAFPIANMDAALRVGQQC